MNLSILIFLLNNSISNLIWGQTYRFSMAMTTTNRSESDTHTPIKHMRHASSIKRLTCEPPLSRWTFLCAFLNQNTKWIHYRHRLHLVSVYLNNKFSSDPCTQHCHIHLTLTCMAWNGNSRTGFMKNVYWEKRTNIDANRVLWICDCNLHTLSVEIELNNTIYIHTQCMCVGLELETQAGYGAVKRQFHLMAATLTATT